MYMTGKDCIFNHVYIHIIVEVNITIYMQQPISVSCKQQYIRVHMPFFLPLTTTSVHTYSSQFQSHVHNNTHASAIFVPLTTTSVHMCACVCVCVYTHINYNLRIFYNMYLWLKNGMCYPDSLSFPDMIQESS